MVYDPLGVTYVVPEGQEPIPVYESGGGIEVFVTDAPYLLANTTSLMHPIPVVDAGGPIWEASDGSLQAAWPVTGLTPPVEYLWVLESGFWEEGKFWLTGKDW